MNELISVIIPVYNQEKYLSHCLESVINQTYKQLEIIIVDDGSIDSSEKIVKNYADQDTRIHIIYKENGGLSTARNMGLDSVHGEYVTFIDSDDWVSKEYIERLYQNIVKYRADIASIGMQKVWDHTKQGLKTTEALKLLEYGKEQAIEEMWYQRSIDNCACGKLYRSSLFQGIRYPAGMLYEDLATTYRLLWKAEKIVHSSEKLYYYFQHTGSIMTRPFDRRNMDRILVSEALLRWADEQNRELREAAKVRFFVSNIQVLREIPLKEEYSKELAIIKKNIRIYRKSVRKNRKAKASIRCIACLSVFNVHLLKRLGDFYKMVYK